MKGSVMGFSRVDKARTHARIVRVAARRLRERGLNGIGVAEVMKDADLTVGGFYKHFASRDDLVAAAIDSTFGLMRGKLANAIADGATLAQSSIVGDYLSPTHRDNPGKGCAFGALGADLARSDDKIRAIATEEIGRTFAQMALLLDKKKPEQARAAAITAYSAMVGALVLSRIASDTALSDEILATVEATLTGRRVAREDPSQPSKMSSK